MDPTTPAIPPLPEDGDAFIALEAIDSPVLKQGLVYWQGLRAGRKFPLRGDITPRGLGGLLRNALLLRVIDSGRDYEYRIVGDAHVLAHGVSVQGKLWSQVNDAQSAHRQMNKVTYDRVVQSGEPVALHSWMERDSNRRQLIYREAVYLPLGADEETVDHILGFSVYFPRAVRDVGG